MRSCKLFFHYINIKIYNLRIASFNTAIPKSTSSLVMHIGGLILKTFPCRPPLPNKTPMSLHVSHIFAILSPAIGFLDFYSLKED